MGPRGSGDAYGDFSAPAAKGRSGNGSCVLTVLSRRDTDKGQLELQHRRSISITVCQPNGRDCGKSATGGLQEQRRHGLVRSRRSDVGGQGRPKLF